MRQLERKPFGQTGLEVTTICVGAAPIGGLPYGDYRVPKEQAIRTLIHLFENPNGPRFLDTASLYGESELRIGEAITVFGGLPEDFVIATKADPRSNNRGY